MCAGFLAFQWADHHVAREAWKDAGVRVRQECDGGDKDGICWIPNSIHPVTARRSHAGLGHYADVHASRLNYDLLVKHQVVRVVYPEGNVTSGVPLVEVLSLNDTAMQSGYKSQQTLTTTLLSNPHPQPRNPLRNRHILLRNHAPPPIPGHNPSQHLLPLSLPLADHRTASNPIDREIQIAHVRFLRRIVATSPTLARLGAVEVAPGLDVQADDQLEEWVRNATVGRYIHPYCTASMIPANTGGVVGTDLKVHSAVGLRVVDISILPFLVSGHLSATAYAVGEKGVGFIVRKWS